MVCDAARGLHDACTKGFALGLQTGNWKVFEDAREKYEEHLISPPNG